MQARLLVLHLKTRKTTLCVTRGYPADVKIPAAEGIVGSVLQTVIVKFG
jgi:hypothetical protein